MFRVGQRVLFQSRSARYFHAASMGLKGVVMHLNAKEEDGTVKPISGRVIGLEYGLEGRLYISFRPDGWLLEESVFPRGFQMDKSYFRDYPEEEPEMAGTIIGQNGRAVSREQIEKAVNERVTL